MKQFRMVRTVLHDIYYPNETPVLKRQDKKLKILIKRKGFEFPFKKLKLDYNFYL